MSFDTNNNNYNSHSLRNLILSTTIGDSIQVLFKCIHGTQCIVKIVQISKYDTFDECITRLTSLCKINRALIQEVTCSFLDKNEETYVDIEPEQRYIFTVYEALRIAGILHVDGARREVKLSFIFSDIPEISDQKPPVPLKSIHEEATPLCSYTTTTTNTPKQLKVKSPITPLSNNSTNKVETRKSSHSSAVAATIITAETAVAGAIQEDFSPSKSEVKKKTAILTQTTTTSTARPPAKRAKPLINKPKMAPKAADDSMTQSVPNPTAETTIISATKNKTVLSATKYATTTTSSIPTKNNNIGGDKKNMYEDLKVVFSSDEEQEVENNNRKAAADAESDSDSSSSTGRSSESDEDPFLAALISKKDEEFILTRFLAKHNYATWRDKDGNSSALYMAAIWGRLKVAEQLIDQGCDLHEPCLLHDIIKSLGFYTARMVLKLYIDHGAPLTTLDENGRTPLLSVVALMKPRGVFEMFKYMVENSASIHVQDKNGMTALHLAIRQDHSQVYSYLIKTLHADGTIRDHDGKTPLDYSRSHAVRSQIAKMIVNTTTTVNTSSAPTTVNTSSARTTVNTTAAPATTVNMSNATITVKVTSTTTSASAPNNSITVPSIALKRPRSSTFESNISQDESSDSGSSSSSSSSSSGSSSEEEDDDVNSISE